jgi:hypothetical protein
MNATLRELFYLIKKTIKNFSYAKFPVKKINVEQNLKLCENRCLIIPPNNILKFKNFRVLQSSSMTSLPPQDWDQLHQKRLHPHQRRRRARRLVGGHPRLLRVGGGGGFPRPIWDSPSPIPSSPPKSMMTRASRWSAASRGGESTLSTGSVASH